MSAPFIFAKALDSEAEEINSKRMVKYLFFGIQTARLWTGMCIF
jgi:hypothetical protein